MAQQYMIHGPHQFPQFNGMVVQAQEVDPLYDEVSGTYSPLYLTEPPTFGSQGEPIHWQRQHLFPLQDFPKEELEEAWHYA